eukprot:TRINITY_DN1092_c0_g1_i6.p1 TRINITY_DN1092_c0_g1~~TRINITY_DN1092_c0_g1_i6.p1  ORF type:complete len:226 (-),score=38.66 TRINITY_DN1092_c0_g1_i6:103-780(-)
MDPKTGKHIPYRNDKALTGTARYASISTHMGIEQSRRDDLEAIAYMLIYMLRGKLPWQGLPNKNKLEKHQKIMQCKIGIAVENLCRDLPNEFQHFLRYTRSLKFEEDPDYDYLKGLLRSLVEPNHIDDGIFDWNAQDTSVEKNRTFLHLIANQNQIARRSSDNDVSPIEKSGQTCTHKKAVEWRGISIQEAGTPQVVVMHNSFLDKYSPRMRMENIGTTNDMFAK